MQIYNFVEWELEKFRKECNFTEEELTYFNLKAKNKSNIQIALEMHISEPKVSKLSKKVKSKIEKVIDK